MAKKRRVAEQASSKSDDVFKVKQKSSNKKAKPTTVKKAKSRQALRHGQDLLDDQFVHIHHQQQQHQSTSTPHVDKVHTPKPHTDIQDTMDRLANL